MNNNKTSLKDSDLIIDAMRALLEESDLDTLFSRLLDKAITVTGAERGYLLLRNEANELEPVVSRGIEAGSIPQGDPSRAIVETALREKRPIISRDAAKDPRFGTSESIIIRGIRSACCIPLEARGNRLGALYLDTTGLGKMTEDQLPALEAFGTLAALAVARAIELSDTKKALEATTTSARFGQIIGDSAPMKRLYYKLERIAAADLPVLITGESGTGKELVARAIHQNSKRSDGPFRAIFCGNLSVELLESELFGYKKGAFTGAVTDKPGLLDMTNGGTLFLDEIADVPTPIQAKLLRFLQNGEYQRLGDPNIRMSDARILSATNKNLIAEIEAGNFRQDLFYRINVLVIELPPLHEREGDIPLLVAAILTKVASRTGQAPKRISSAALSKLNAYNWPGNVRELENVLARAAVLSTSDILDAEDIDIEVGAVELKDESPLDTFELDDVITNHIKRVLRHTQGNRSEAAKLLGVSRRYLQKLLAKWREEGE